MDRTLWYTLDYEVLGEILLGVVEGRAQMDVRNLRRSYQVDHTEQEEGGRGPTSLLEDPGAAGRWVRGEEAHPLAPEAGEARGEAWGEELGELGMGDARRGARGAQAAPQREAGRNCAERAFCEVARPSPTRPQHSSPGTASTRRPTRVLHVAWGHLLLEITPLNRH